MGGRIVRLGRDMRGDGDEEGMDVEERMEDVEGDVSLELGSDVLLALDLRIICSWRELGPPSSNMTSRDSMNLCVSRCMRRKALH